MKIKRDNKEYIVAEGHDWFWPAFGDNSWEPSTFKIFDTFLEKDKTFVDIGAWIGPTVLYAASKAKQVFAFEPDPVAYDSLCRNIRLNEIENVTPYSVAVADKWKSMKFGARTQYGDSMSSELWGKRGQMVPAVSLEAVILDLSPNFIKIDIEGGEKTIFDNSILALQECKPTIHLSLHTPWFTGDEYKKYKESIMESLERYPFFYGEDLGQIKLENAFIPTVFNSIVATYKKL